jgi:hypothetical protein
VIPSTEKGWIQFAFGIYFFAAASGALSYIVTQCTPLRRWLSDEKLMELGIAIWLSPIVTGILFVAFMSRYYPSAPSYDYDYVP